MFSSSLHVTENGVIYEVSVHNGRGAAMTKSEIKCICNNVTYSNMYKCVNIMCHVIFTSKTGFNYAPKRVSRVVGQTRIVKGFGGIGAEK